MSLSLCVPKRLLLPAMLMALPVFLMGESVIAPQGSEYLIPGPLPGDQVGSSISINQSGGYVVWEENGNLKTGTEISAARLDSNFNKTAVIKINKIPKGDQRNPQVRLLNNGDALFVWQGYGLGNADIYARLLKSDGTFGTSDIRVNSIIKDQQSRPVISKRFSFFKKFLSVEEISSPNFSSKYFLSPKHVALFDLIPFQIMQQCLKSPAGIKTFQIFMDGRFRREFFQSKFARQFIVQANQFFRSESDSV